MYIYISIFDVYIYIIYISFISFVLCVVERGFEELTQCNKGSFLWHETWFGCCEIRLDANFGSSLILGFCFVPPTLP